MGIGAAFKLYGSPDAANFGGPDIPTFVFGNDAIGAAVGAGSPPNTSAVNWGPEKTIIAPSGDFGVTIGYIVRNQPGPTARAGQDPARTAVLHHLAPRCVRRVALHRGVSDVARATGSTRANTSLTVA